MHCAPDVFCFMIVNTLYMKGSYSVSRHLNDKIVIGLLLLAFLSQLMLAPWLGENQLSTIRHLALEHKNQDAMLICTGTSMKWASQQVFIDTGRIQFVEPPKDIPNDIQDIECSNGLLVKFSSDLPILSDIVVSRWQQYLAIVQSLVQRPYTAFPYQTGLSRAPPLQL